MGDDQRQESAEAPAEAKPKRSAGRPFVKGDPRIAQNMRKAAEEGEQTGDSAAPLCDGNLLTAMRYVVTKPLVKGESPLQRKCREWLKKNVAVFMAKLADMEAAEKRKVKEADPEKTDEVSGKVIGLIDELLAEWKDAVPR